MMRRTAYTDSVAAWMVAVSLSVSTVCSVSGTDGNTVKGEDSQFQTRQKN
jgi:hypothetical protein